MLSFKILWDDSSYDGGEKFYVLNYYLADSKMEVKEIRVQNSGKDAFPMMLKKQKVPKTPVLTHYPGMSMREEEYYQPEDIICGKTVKIYGRDCLVFSCDDFTTQWYQKNHNLNQTPLNLRKGAPNVIYQPSPIYDGLGTEEDSMGSVTHLTPKPPRKDVQKMFKSDMHVLRFDVKLISTEPDDENRKFILSFFCGDDTIQVYEICDKNSGRIGGKFLERKKHKNPVTDIYYAEKDFLIGKTIYIAGWKFQISSGDEYTEKFMEDNEESFPEAQIKNVMQKIKDGAKHYGSLDEYAVELVKHLDKNNDNLIDFKEFSTGLQGMNIFLTDHEVHTLVRRFDHNGDGKISIEEFYNTLASVQA